MKILIVPMLAIAQTAGPFSRAKFLAETFIKRGINVALCTANDGNSKRVDGASHYALSVPTPMGLPNWIGSRIYPLAEKFGVIGRKPITSFEEVLHVTGASAYPYLKASIREIRSAIHDFQPDVVYSEFNISAIIAAKAENKPLFASYSYPTQPSYASSPQFAGGVNMVLDELKQSRISSVLEIFKIADYRVIPSSYTLEPICGENNLFVGPLKEIPLVQNSKQKNCILVYMGNGSVSRERIKKVIIGAFRSSPYEVFIAGMKSKEDNENIHLAQKFEFSDLLPKTAVYINHGGQNSIMDGFLYGVPQLVCPGKVFERKYNADSVEKNGAGLSIDLSEYRVDIVSKAVDRLITDNNYQENARKLGSSLSSLGGADAVADYITSNF